MPGLVVQPFAEEHLDAAGGLLAERHGRHREAAPLLPERYEDAASARAEVEALWHAEGAAGVVALRDSRAVGFLLGNRRRDDVWGPNVWIEAAGHAADSAEDVRDMYAVVAARWVDAGRTRHYALLPAADRALVDAWFRLSFGQQHAFGIREVPEAAGAVEGVRVATERDVDALVALTPLLGDHQSRSPVFSPGMPAQAEEELRREILEDVASEKTGNLVAERDGRVVGAFDVVPVEISSMHAGLARPHGAALLAWAATLPDVRGSGAGLALTEATFAWAREHGFGTIVTDWRVTNLLSSRFWPRRGFRTTFLRLYRSIP